MKNNDFGTVNKIDYSPKTSDKFVKCHGDIQKTSFVIGFQGNPFNSWTPNGDKFQANDRSRPTQSLRASSELARNSFALKGTVKMLKEHFAFGKEPSEFKTINQGYYRWIQPRGDRYS